VFAVLEDGVIKESILVFTVKKSATTVDYHDNIDRKHFRRWVETLVAALDKTGRKYIIVMVRYRLLLAYSSWRICCSLQSHGLLLKKNNYVNIGQRTVSHCQGSPEKI
jgi:hypothetical protein